MLFRSLRSLSLQLDEPRIESRGAIWVAVRESTTWQIASLWSRLQASKHRHRDGVRIIAEVQDWIEMQQKRGSLPEVLPDELDPRRIDLPEELFQRVLRAQQQQESQSVADAEPIAYWIGSNGPKEMVVAESVAQTTVAHRKPRRQQQQQQQQQEKQLNTVLKSVATDSASKLQTAANIAKIGRAHV